MSLKQNQIAVWAAAILLLSPSLAPAGDQDPSVAIAWNQKLQDTIGATGGPLGPRWFATMHIAMFDAMNSIAREYTPFRSSVAASSGASLEAAGAQAARDVLVALLPANQAAYDALLASQLAGIPPGPRTQGVAVGRAAAIKILEWRVNDGVGAGPFPYSPPLLAGMWQGTPGLTQVPFMVPFTLKTNTQFLPRRFPEINTAAYAEDYNEVREVGSLNSASRTAEQTQTAKLFAALEITSTTIVTVWNNVVRDTALSQHQTLLQAARQFAMTNALIIDGLITSQSGKFIYALWRPLAAINSTLDDLNAATTPEPGWMTLIGTPPYPTYPGNMACVGAVAARSLALGAGSNDLAFSVTWKGANGFPDVTRHYAGFQELAQQEADSRIYGGIHFRFDNEASQEYCPKVADHAFATVARPR